jgi:hypothetical protein
MPTYNVARGSFMNAIVSAIRIASGRACQRATAFMQIYVQLLEGRKMIANKILIDIMCLCSMEAGRARFPCGCDSTALRAPITIEPSLPRPFCLRGKFDSSKIDPYRSTSSDAAGSYNQFIICPKLAK